MFVCLFACVSGCSKVSGTFLIHFNFDTFLVDFLVLYLEDFGRFSITFSLNLLKI